MALSPKMLALVLKIEAADAKHFAGLRESARQEAEAADDEAGHEPPGRRRAGEEGTAPAVIDGMDWIEAYLRDLRLRSASQLIISAPGMKLGHHGRWKPTGTRSATRTGIRSAPA